MQQQLSFSQAEFQAKKKVTRRERFLGDLEQIVPWVALLEELRPHYYPKAGQGPGRPPIALERMLRMYFLQLCFTLADEALEDAIYDSQAFRNFLRIDLSRERVPDATTLGGFRHWLEDGELGKALFARINAELEARRLMLHRGTLLDATIIVRCQLPWPVGDNYLGRSPASGRIRVGPELMGMAPLAGPSAVGSP
jgi:IS5 family transposase